MYVGEESPAFETLWFVNDAVGRSVCIEFGDFL
jgi:hypothetical protein